MDHNYLDQYPIDYSLPEVQQLLSPEEMIQREYKALIYDYEHSNHRNKVDIIERAFLFAKKAHEGMYRKSMEPYILHPLAVARILSREMGLGSTSIVSALLHDVVEDTPYTIEDIESLFGSNVAKIVEGLTKISKDILTQTQGASLQAENYRKLFLTMNDDIRVVLIKIADRLHNMRTIGSMPEHKKMKIAGETELIYAPLAHRLGLFAIKTELEDLAFKAEYPKEYEFIRQQIIESKVQREELFRRFSEPIHEQLHKMRLEYEMTARTKSCCSIYRKMKRKNIPFEEVYDLYAVRIVFKERPQEDPEMTCLAIYREISKIYTQNHERFRDWTIKPKNNGYRALHMTVMGPDGKFVEVQIRSTQMDDVAERGLAAHWKYKGNNIEEDRELENTLNHIKELLAEPDSDAMEVFASIQLNLYNDEISVYTPKGTIKVLPKDSVVLDFAYAVHTDMGNTCIGGKVNGQLRPWNYPLSNGDQVEIVFGDQPVVSHLWLKHVKTVRAQKKIREYLREERRKMELKGESEVLGLFEKYGHKVEASHLDKLAEVYAQQRREDFFYAVGIGKVHLDKQTLQKRLESSESRGNLRHAIMNMLKGKTASSTTTTESTVAQISPKDIDFKKPYILLGGETPNYRLATDCSIVPGDPVVAFYLNGDVVVHHRSCPEALQLKSSRGDRLLNCTWGDQGGMIFKVSIMIQGIDSKGVLNSIIPLITDAYQLDICAVQLQSQDGIFGGRVTLQVPSLESLNQVCQELKQVPCISSVYRLQD